MSRAAITCTGLLLLLSHCAVAQSQRQLAERRVRSTEVRTVDERKGARTVRIVNTSYDGRGNVLELKEREEDGRLLKWERHTYDRKGHELSESVLDSSGVEVERTEHTWDRWGNEVRTVSMKNGRAVETTVVIYDKYGDRRQELVTDGEGRTIRRTEFEYESRGMIKRRAVFDANDQLVYERTYAYTP